MSKPAEFIWGPPGVCKKHWLHGPANTPKGWTTGKTFVVHIPGREAIRVTRDNINRNSSEFNAEATVSLVGSADFIEALADYLFEVVDPETSALIEQTDEPTLMSWVEVVE